MKRRKLRRWVEILLQIIAILSFIVLTSDSDNLNHFILVHLIGVIFLITSTTILYKYSK